MIPHSLDTPLSDRIGRKDFSTLPCLRFKGN